MMKHLRLFVLLLASLSFGATLQAKVDPKEATYLELFGWATGAQASLPQFGFSDEEFEVFVKGLQAASQGKPALSRDPAMYNDMHEYLMEKARNYETKKKMIDSEDAERNLEEAQPFYNELDNNPDVQKSETGLYYEIIEEGSDRKPNAKSNVRVHYVGQLIDGTVFDSSKARGQPAEFGLENVIPGFREGLQLIGEGGRIRLYVPPHLGYGDQALPTIPAGSTLIFDVDMLSFTG